MDKVKEIKDESQDHVHDIKQADLTKLLLDAAAYRRSRILLSGIQVGIFNVLNSQFEATAQSIAETLKLNERSVEKLLGGLVAIDVVAFDGAYYRNTPTSQAYLVPGSPSYIGEGIQTLFDIGQDTWGTLTEAVLKGVPLAKQRTDNVEADFWPRLTQAIRPFSVPVADSVAGLLLWKKDKIKKVLDLGGGSGVFGQSFLKIYPDVKVYQVDWPQVNAVAKKFNAEAAKDGRFITLDGDIFETQWEQEGPFDVVILSHIIHQEPLSRIETLMRRIGKCIDKDSNVVINEYFVNEKKNYPPYSLIFGLSMMLQNHGGGVYSYSECQKMLEVIGHEIYHGSSPLPPATIYISRAKASKAIKLVDSSERTHTEIKQVVPPSFISRGWDTATKETREGWLVDLFYKQLAIASEKSKFWKKNIPNKIFQSKKNFSRKDIESLPVFTKGDLRIVNPYDLTLGDAKSWHKVHASGGTTGVPTTLFWSEADWRASVETSVRFLSALRSWKGLKIWNGYNQAHVAGPVFDDIIRMLGATPIPRHFKSTDEDAIKDIERLKADALVLTPKSGSGKGGSLEDFLAIDPNFISRLGIKNLFISSTGLDKNLHNELKELGVERIINFYGSTEAMPTAISCSAHVNMLHICNGQNFLEVVDQNGHHVANGQTGAVLVSRIASSTGNEVSNGEGTQLFRFVVGDTALYTDEPCECGLKTPRISDIKRVVVDNDKIVGGCERWD